MAGNKSLNNYTFFKEKTTTGFSDDYIIVGDQSQMTLKIVATGTFQLKVTSDISPKGTTFKLYPCYQLPNMTPITDVISDATKLYIVDLVGVDYLRLEVVALTGNLSVYGKVVG